MKAILDFLTILLQFSLALTVSRLAERLLIKFVKGMWEWAVMLTIGLRS